MLGGAEQEAAGKIPGSSTRALSWGDGQGQEDAGKDPGSPGKILTRGHKVSDERMSELIATFEKSTGKRMTIAEIAYALSVSNAKATAIRNMTPKTGLNGSAHR